MVWTPPRTRDVRDSHSVLVWFGSPRQAVRILFGLRGLAPASDLRLASASPCGAEGAIVVAWGHVPAVEEASFRRALEALELDSIWDEFGDSAP